VNLKGYYFHHIGLLRRDLRNAIPLDILKQWHQPSAWKHFAVLLRQLAIAAAAVGIILQFDSLWIWLPCSIVLGFIAFDFTVLLHEVVHRAVFAKNRPRWNALLGWLYALPSGISRTQFTRWHLDHHAELGSWTDDPKRAHLTPKIVKRWYKFLYMTPALFPIYFRAAAREAKKYPLSLRKKIKIERSVTIFLHLSAMLGLTSFGSVWLFVKLYAIPYFFVFPIAFTINRIGQHYNINPENPAAWSTLMKGHRFWDFVYLNSNYHLEHHYFPGVPFYNLPQVQAHLHSFYEKQGMNYQTYGQVLYGWFVENRPPHADWSMAKNENAPSSAG